MSVKAVRSEVVLLGYTNRVDLPAKAARFCTSDAPVEEIMEVNEAVSAILKRVIEMGHLSVLEHFNVTFGVSGISRVTEVQLARHRIGTSCSIKSGRYTTAGPEFQAVIPLSIAASKWVIVGALEVTAENLIELCHQFYLRLIAAGVPAEDARFILPQATATQLMVTMNARQLLHFFSERCCSCAQWEIRGMAGQMLTICRELQPDIFNLAGPKCEVLGYCPESKTKHCGRKPHKKEFFQ